MTIAVIGPSSPRATLGFRPIETQEIDMRKPLTLIAVAPALAIAVGCAAAGESSGAAASHGTGPAALPALPPPAGFARLVDNPWYPLRPGTVLTYRGRSDGRPAQDVFRVTRRTKTIEGIRATVVDDRVYMGGRLEERTNDWYAQDKVGNVWYLGEATATLDSGGHVKSREGSWRTGQHGARAGIFMPANPRAGRTGRQEYYKGHAEDDFRILGFGAHVHTPAVSSRHALLVQETSPLEPGVVDHKVYVRGVGTAVEQTVRGGNERFELVARR
jgi:hypothetical protein